MHLDERVQADLLEQRVQVVQESIVERRDDQQRRRRAPHLRLPALIRIHAEVPPQDPQLDRPACPFQVLTGTAEEVGLRQHRHGSRSGRLVLGGQRRWIVRIAQHPPRR
jgi:hypothetical protein